MNRRELALIDKSKWPRGPWDQEPDKVEWTDDATGLACQAIRNTVAGHWCAYVGVAEGHPAFQKHYDDVEASAHGGLTFAGVKGELWWLGFDCAHCWDLLPALMSGELEFLKSHKLSLSWAALPAGVPELFGMTYRDLGYVENECRGLAAQLAEIAAVAKMAMLEGKTNG